MKKTKVVFKSFLLIALALSLSSSVSASEVLGNLSAGSPNTNSNSTTGSLSGSVTSQSSSGGGGGSGSSGGTGTVLGASTSPLATNFSSDGQAMESSSGNLAIGQPTDGFLALTSTEEMIDESFVTPAEAYTQTAAAANASTTGSWLWIALLLLLLVGAILYMYSKNTKRDIKKVAK